MTTNPLLKQDDRPAGALGVEALYAYRDRLNAHPCWRTRGEIWVVSKRKDGDGVLEYLERKSISHERN